MVKLLIFDMDGVLVDTSSSYDETIIQTIKHFSPNLGNLQSTIHALRLEGGYNDDWTLTGEILKRNMCKIGRSEIIKKFQQIYLGNNWDGLINSEKWLLDKSILEKLAKKYSMAIFTGRPFEEAKYALKFNKVERFFGKLVAREHVSRLKPDPEGINILIKHFSPDEAYYIGDTADDAIAAKNAGIGFIGITPPGLLNKNQYLAAFKKHNAVAYFNEVNKIMELFL